MTAAVKNVWCSALKWPEKKSDLSERPKLSVKAMIPRRQNGIINGTTTEVIANLREYFVTFRRSYCCCATCQYSSATTGI